MAIAPARRALHAGLPAAAPAPAPARSAGDEDAVDDAEAADRSDQERLDGADLVAQGDLVLGEDLGDPPLEPAALLAGPDQAFDQERAGGRHVVVGQAVDR